MESESSAQNPLSEARDSTDAGSEPSDDDTDESKAEAKTETEREGREDVGDDNFDANQENIDDGAVTSFL